MSMKSAPGSLSALSIEEFSRRLASGEPTPGGGAVAALMAKLSADLVAMVCHHTLGRAKYQAVEERMRAIVAETKELGRQAGELMDADAASFREVAAAFKRPKDDPQREAFISDACKAATEVPLAVMRAARQVAVLATEVASSGNQTLITDSHAALLVAQAAAEASAGNVRANRAYILDAAWAGRAAAEAQDVLTAIAHVREQL